MGQGVAPQHGAKPSDPLNGPYAPFQRWTWFGRYLTYPTATIGKLFFSLNGSNFVCSATTINRSTVITAGHCNSDGAGTVATNRLFCPSYNKGGPSGSGAANTTAGCWSVIGSMTATPWHSGGDPDYDYACLITNTTGTVVSDKIGNFTGWLGRAWNLSSSQAEMAFGYPAAAPFLGYHIITVASSEWYTSNFTAGGQVSKFIGSDMTAGSSGGPWIIGWGHRNAEYADTDSSSVTDPGDFQFPLVNGVNSHQRCKVSCGTPPNAASGTYWQEISSPPFLDSAAGDEMKDVTDFCFGHANNDP